MAVMRWFWLALILLLSGCTAPDGASTDPNAASAPEAASPEPPARVETPLSYEGRLGHQVCTFGSIRHQCDGTPGDNTFYALGTLGPNQTLAGSVAYLNDPAAPPRIDIFLLVDHGAGYVWEREVHPYSSGSSPQTYSWDLSEFDGLAAGLFVFGSHTQYVDPVGVSAVPDTPFSVDAVVVIDV